MVQSNSVRWSFYLLTIHSLRLLLLSHFEQGQEREVLMLVVDDQVEPLVLNPSRIVA